MYIKYEDILVIQKFSHDLCFAIFRFPYYSGSFKFTSKHSCGWSFLSVETMHANCSFLKLKSCSS